MGRGKLFALPPPESANTCVLVPNISLRIVICLWVVVVFCRLTYDRTWHCTTHYKTCNLQKALLSLNTLFHWNCTINCEINVKAILTESHLNWLVGVFIVHRFAITWTPLCKCCHPILACRQLDRWRLCTIFCLICSRQARSNLLQIVRSVG